MELGGMQVIGVVGGIASGKSLVSKALEELGAVRIDADLLGHEVLLEPAVMEALVNRWGPGVLDPQGAIDRRAVARIVFAPRGEHDPGGAADLHYLESLSHPRIKERMVRRIRELEAEGRQVVVLDAALLVEAGWAELCQHVLFVESPWEQRVARAALRGWTADELSDRESHQRDLADKRRRADWVIDNSGSADDTIAQVHQFWRARIVPLHTHPR